MIDQDLITKAICRATRDVFEIMLQSEVEVVSVSSERHQTSAVESLVVMVGLAGQWAGAGTITCSPRFAADVAAKMLMMDSVAEPAAITNDTLDAVAELANMIIGNVKTELEESLGPMGISIPTVIYGRNFSIRQAGLEQVEVAFRCNGSTFDVYVGLTQGSHAQAPGRSHVAVVPG